MFPIQTKALDHMNANRFSIFMHSRNVGILNAYTRNVLDYVATNPYCRVFICSPSTLARELFDNISKLIHPALVSEKTNKVIKLHNGCYIKHSKVHKNMPGWGFGIEKFILLDAALVPNAILNDFYRSLFPTISARRDATISIASGPNGKKNLFYDLFTNAEAGLNDYKPMRIYYWMIEGRDEQWVKERIKEMGSEEAFNQEYNLVFYDKKKNI